MQVDTSEPAALCEQIKAPAAVGPRVIGSFLYYKRRSVCTNGSTSPKAKREQYFNHRVSVASSLRMLTVANGCWIKGKLRQLGNTIVSACFTMCSAGEVMKVMKVIKVITE